MILGYLILAAVGASVVGMTVYVLGFWGGLGAIALSLFLTGMVALGIHLIGA